MLPRITLEDEAEMREFYRRMGISPEVTELAIIAKRNRPEKPPRKPHPMKGKKRKAVSAK
jgi:hypothetical protein